MILPVIDERWSPKILYIPDKSDKEEIFLYISIGKAYSSFFDFPMHLRVKVYLCTAAVTYVQSWQSKTQYWSDRLGLGPKMFYIKHNRIWTVNEEHSMMKVSNIRNMFGNDCLPKHSKYIDFSF